MVAPFLRHPPADGTGPTVLAPVQPGANGGGAGEPLDYRQLAGQALPVEAGAGGGGFRHEWLDRQRETGNTISRCDYERLTR